MGDAHQIKMPIVMTASIVLLSVSWITSGNLFLMRLPSDDAITEKDSKVQVGQYMGPISFFLVIAFASFVMLTCLVEIRVERIRTLFGRKASHAADPNQVDTKQEEQCENFGLEEDLKIIREIKNELKSHF